MGHQQVLILTYNRLNTEVRLLTDLAGRVTSLAGDGSGRIDCITDPTSA